MNLLSENFSVDDIRKHVGVSRSCVYKFLKRYRERKTIENLPHTGRPKKTTVRDDRHLIRTVLSNRRQSLGDITNSAHNFIPVSLSSRTIRRRLRQHDFRRRKIAKALTICRQNRKRRVAWCKNKLSWSLEKWNTVIFSDETQVVLDHSRNVFVWRRPSERWRPECLGKLQGRRRISVMFWGCVTYHRVGKLVPVDGIINSEKYINILDENLWPVIAKHFIDRPYIFQDDNAPVHRSKLATNWKTENKINGMTWPAQSSDLNIIENIWRTIKIRLQTKCDEIKTRSDLIDTVVKIWASLHLNYIQSLYHSLPSRLRSVIVAKGYPTKY